MHVYTCIIFQCVVCPCMPFHGRATHGSIEIGEANVTIDRGFQHVIAHGSSFRIMARDANRKGNKYPAKNKS